MKYILLNPYLSRNRYFLLLFDAMLKIINEAVDGMIVTSNQKTTQKTTQEKIINLIKKNPAVTQVEMDKILDLN